MMPLYFPQRRRIIAFFIFGISLVFLTSGCEPLRHKFVRKKKAEKAESNFIPVLEPIDYPNRIISAQERYRYHYSLWQVWEKELQQSFSHQGWSQGNDKQQKYLLGQIITQLEEMRKLVSADKRDEVGGAIKELKAIADELNEPAAMRNTFFLQKQLRLSGRKIRRDFNPAKIPDDAFLNL